MKKLINFLPNNIIKNPFLISSLVMVIGSNIYNAGQFIYHIVAGRILGPAFYGDLAALINILGIFGLVQISIGLTIVKFISSEKQPEKAKGLTQWAIIWSSGFGISVAVLLVVFAPFISSFLQLTQPAAIYLLAPVIFLYATTTITRSVLQGLLRFGWFVGSLLSEVSIKLILMIPFVFAGYAVIGALGALLIGVFGSLFIGLYPLRDYLKGWGIKPETSPLIKYSIPAFFQGIALTSMYTIDLFLVKHYFTPESAGLYAALAKLGSIVFFGASPITHVMFPLVARKHSHGEAYHKIFYLSLFLIGGIVSLVILNYILFPLIFLSTLGQNFLEGAPILWWFGVFMGLLAIAMLFIQFYLSIGKVFVVWLFLAAAFLQALLIVLFHASLVMVIQMSIVAAALLVLSLLIYFPYHDPSPKGLGGGK